jgi:hypothetical protein
MDLGMNYFKIFSSTVYCYALEKNYLAFLRHKASIQAWLLNGQIEKVHSLLDNFDTLLIVFFCIAQQENEDSDDYEWSGFSGRVKLTFSFQKRDHKVILNQFYMYGDSQNKRLVMNLTSLGSVKPIKPTSLKITGSHPCDKRINLGSQDDLFAIFHDFEHRQAINDEAVSVENESSNLV